MAKSNQGAPQLINAEDFKPGGLRSRLQRSKNQGPWFFCRGLGQQGGFHGLKLRFKYAWGVFTGKYDALQWGDGQ